MPAIKTKIQRLEFNPGQLIFREGQPGHHAYLIRVGKVTIFTTVNGHKTKIATMVPGQILGEMAIITGQPRSASAEAAEYCELLVMDKKTLAKTLDESLPIIKALLNQLVKRIQETERNNPPEGSERERELVSRIHSLERAMRSINDNAADWLLAQPDMDPSARQCLQLIRNTCQLQLEKP